MPATPALTLTEHARITDACRELFVAKLGDYGASWRHFRLLSIVDQIFIKARRLRRLEELGTDGMVGEKADGEYVGVVNYCVIALDKLAHMPSGPDLDDESPTPERWATPDAARATFSQVVNRSRDVLLKKNHDYGEAWRDMARSSFTDEILGRTERIKGILATKNGPAVSEGIESQLIDAMNYAILALAQMQYPRR